MRSCRWCSASGGSSLSLAPPSAGSGVSTSTGSSLPAAQDAEANERLDAALEAFLRLLSAYFLLPAATRALEYLVRRYKCARRACRARALPQCGN